MTPTHDQRLQQDLLSAQQELAAIHANAPVILFLVDEELHVSRPGHTIGCFDALADPAGCGHTQAGQDCPIRAAALDSLAHGTRHQVEAWAPRTIEGRTETRCLLVSTSPVPFTGIKKILVCAQDITDLKRAVQQLESALAEKTVLFKEVHHRVKNNLAVVCSLLRMKADAAGSGEARMALEASHRRVHSMALIHEQLCESDRLDRINFSEYAQQLVERLRQAFVDDPTRVSIQTALDPIELGIEQAVPCGLILNELLTNAFKYAFPAGSRGKIFVSFHQPDPGLLELAIEDNGIGVAGELRAERTTSLGLHIVGILTNQLDGTLEDQPCSGTRIVLRFPLRKDVLPRPARST